MNPLYDLTPERAIIGCCVMRPEIVPEVCEMIRPEDFGAESHAELFRALHDLSNNGKAIDYIAIGEQLKLNGAWNLVGGAPAVEALSYEVPASPNWKAYAESVRELSLRRRLIVAAQEVQARAMNLEVPLADVVSEAETSMLAVSDASAHKSNMVAVRDMVGPVMKELEVLASNGQVVTGVPTGIKELDEKMTGFHPGELIIIGARPSVGKSSALTTMALFAATATKKPVAIFNMEMKNKQTFNRLLSNDARVDGNRLRTGQFTDSDWPKLMRGANTLYNSTIFLDDSRNIDAVDMRARCRRIRSRYGPLAFVGVDYLQLMRASKSAGNREQAVAEFSRGLKLLAGELDCPVVALAQLNRESEKRADKRPGMADLRESGAIEADADAILLLHRDDMSNPNSEHKGEAEIIVVKQRDGWTGSIFVKFDREHTLLRDLPNQNRGYP